MPWALSLRVPEEYVKPPPELPRFFEKPERLAREFGKVYVG